MKRIGNGIIKKTFAVSLVFVLIISILTITNFSIKDVLADTATTCGLCWINPDLSTTIDPPADWTDSESWSVVALPGYPKTLIPTGSALEWEDFIIHYPGSHVSLADPQINPEVSISAASEIGSDCVTLNGSVTDMNQANWAVVYFTYGVGSAYNNSTDPELTRTAGSFSKQVCGLDPRETYSYRLIVTNLNNNKSEFSSSASFTTDKDAQSAPSAPIVIDAGSTYITLNTVSGCEYMRDGGGTWQSSPTFGGLTPETSYTFYQRYAETATQLASPSSTGTSESTLAGFSCGSSSVVFDGITYGTVSNNGECWLDRNLGATRVATAYNDSASYGGYYQWGRLTDGHQIRGSDTISTTSSTDVPGHDKFIVGISQPRDWRNPQNNNRWQGVSGDNNPCPSGWRVPTKNELLVETNSWGEYSKENAFASLLKWPSNGQRVYTDGHENVVGYHPMFWTSDYEVDYYGAKGVFYSYGNMTDTPNTSGAAVRCIYEGKQEQSAPPAPTVASSDLDRIILNEITNGEYKIAGGEWVNTPVFSGLDSDITYTFYQRYAETSTQNASPASSSVLVTTPACGSMSVIYEGESYETVSIGDQCWLDKNLNVGTMLASASTQPNTSNDIIEKWCYNNSSSNCDTDGGLYSWDEAMKGSTTQGSQGICPDGWHIPTNTEGNSITTKEMFNIPFYPGIRNNVGYSLGDSYLYLWFSTGSLSNAYNRHFLHSQSTVYHTTSDKGNGFSIRCMKGLGAQSAPLAPTASAFNINETSITLDTISNGEYMREGDGTWQISPTFSGLSSNTAYTFYQRYAETDTQLASPSSPSATFYTTDVGLPFLP